MSNELDSIREKLILNAQNDLETLNETASKEYRGFLESISKGVCNGCKQKLDLVYAEETDDGFSYKFACGHGYNGITVKDKVVVRDSLRIRKNRSGIAKFVLEQIQGWFPSIREDLSPEGVRKVRIIDREKNYYKEEVTDSKTGRVIRSVEEKLSDHNK